MTDDVTERGLSAALTDALGPVAQGSGADFSVAVLDTRSGTSGVHGDGSYATASIVKVGILAALLLRAEDEGRPLTAQERSHAAVMIEQSDNDAATALWQTIGGAAGLDAAHRRLGLTATRAGSGGSWGVTLTTAADQLALLRAVFSDDSALNGRARRYLGALMGRVVARQSWGVSAAADGDGSGTRLKNGWMPRDATGLWVVNSIGEVPVDGRAYLVAVLSEGSADLDSGVALVEKAARTAVTAARAHRPR
ncbi:serine hydrolase [Streptomyces melanosporofaciens]|uniref:Beta-lactamase enzyme family protein n=1 Tax=Streptomyces melanosporofaciens TaxID=67327 RepID=A0A1H4W730_STRMJ|nr:serine hydrolase [Streptomyces melanosporofaciens]SEC88910.1 Beta-lactamase enzyme family protein [Streptomyces melanosporofaciens]